MLIVVYDKAADMKTTRNVLGKFAEKNDEFVCFYDIQDMIRYIENYCVNVLVMNVDKPYQEYILIVNRIKRLYRNINIIFISSDINCVPYLYCVEHRYFLLKPFSLKLVKDCMQKVKMCSDNTEVITVSRGRRVNRIDTEEIVYFEAIGHNVMAHRCDNTTEVYKVPISELEKMGEKYSLCRCHRSFIVNMKMVKDIKSGTIIMKTGAEVSIGRNFYKDFQKKFTYFCGDGI